MAESRTETQHAQKEIEKERASDAGRRQTERITEAGREGTRQTAAASTAAAEGTVRSGSALTEGAREITAAWARYAEDVVRHTSEASQALLRARNLAEMLEVQTDLLRNDMQAFLEQSARISEAASRMATRPFQALREASAEQPRR
jgi:hypothetical protein